MQLSDRLASLLAGEPESDAEARHRTVIRAQIEKIEGKLMAVSGWCDFRSVSERAE